jgi:hypothetical protein
MANIVPRVGSYDELRAWKMDSEKGSRDLDLSGRIVEMRDKGASWKEVQEVFGLTRQQARYAYQLGKRAERRRTRGAST